MFDESADIVQFIITECADSLDHATGMEKRELLAKAAGDDVSFYHLYHILVVLTNIILLSELFLRMLFWIIRY